MLSLLGGVSGDDSNERLNKMVTGEIRICFFMLNSTEQEKKLETDHKN